MTERTASQTAARRPRLTYRQAEMLRSFARHSTQQLGITHPTATALKKRGLLDFDLLPDRLLSVAWRLTEAGKAYLA